MSKQRKVGACPSRGKVKGEREIKEVVFYEA
jgi:hypothetical protein